MTAIIGGTDLAAEAQGHPAGPSAVRVLDAVVTCAGRWGIDKTTVDDIAREAGVSRATIYRLFPGGKPAMVRTATDREAVALLGVAMDRVAACDTLAEAVAELLCAGYDTLCSQAVLAFMRSHEPAKLRAFFSFERLDSLLRIAAEVVSPSLRRFLDPEQSRIAVMWTARLVVSHFVQPDDSSDLSDPVAARHLADTYILPGLLIEQAHPTIQEQHQ